MNLLFFDVTNDWIIVAVYKIGDSVTELYSYRGIHPRESSYRLIGDIDRALVSTGIEKPDGLAVCIGPGSFTGIRISAGTGRNLSQIWKIPVTGIDSVEMYSGYYFQKTGQPALVLIDGKQKKVYAGYNNGKYTGSFDILPENLGEHFTTEQLTANIYTNSPLVTSGNRIGEEIPDPLYAIESRKTDLITASFQSRNYMNLLPNYLRPSYAE